MERFQQTMKNWLRAQPRQPATLAELQAAARHVRRHLQHPAAAPLAAGPRGPRHCLRRRPKARPGDRAADTHDRVRTDRIDETGLVTLRHRGRLHHIGVGRAHAGTHVLLLVQDLDIRVINAGTGELLRELTLDPSQELPAHRPPIRPAKENTPTLTRVRGVLDVLRHHNSGRCWVRTNVG